jgi:GntR family transcriptional regulator, trigonelline degradation regulator
MATAPETEPQDMRIREMPRTLREMALERIRAAIVDLRFKPGQRLTERDLCAQLGVSRSVVREVIRHLETEGLVQSVPHHGPVVASLDAAQAAQIYEIRALLEASAAEAAALARDPQQLAAMEEALGDIETAYGAGDTRAVVAATTRFYEAMFTCGGKHVAWDMVQRLNGRISRLRAMTIASPGRKISGPVELRRILEAISRGDSEAATRTCRNHVARAAAIAAKLLADGTSA